MNVEIRKTFMDNDGSDRYFSSSIYQDFSSVHMARYQFAVVSPNRSRRQI